MSAEKTTNFDVSMMSKDMLNKRVAELTLDELSMIVGGISNTNFSAYLPPAPAAAMATAPGEKNTTDKE